MLGKLFGSKPKAQAPPVIDPQETIERLDKQSEVVQKRIKVLENKVSDLKATAIAKNKAGDKRGALMAMKNMKM